MTFDDQIRRTTDSMLAARRGHVEAELRALVQPLPEAAADEQRASTRDDARIPPAVRARCDDFTQELVRALADGDRALLG